ncbi:Enamine deaminase RidA, house cleaning of reactive enamine intermediates, YjgF/YER057c/UK114 family [Sinomicrobium oceani]|uniref:Enamine deaminase RidA, house cleaning of reactive enamine intermediates, YjgF/YER057c/UK114 family n=1 Tax=Sinomicrobium oceani TaxID=1150368 RepID=A0A1K1RB69_9FLAO|nr:RidA family protein [Sinomicrobium oceani]SFW68910.1 Enamine deaminase RidA, house cleaning of reactive enamine intermediates, YjgF/YER057c/UK114 family [Sinomicrobium oceani]
METQRRGALRKIATSVLGLVGAAAFGKTLNTGSPENKPDGSITRYGNEEDENQEVPLFSSSVVHNGLVYIAGKGAHFEGDVKDHTEHVLEELKKELEKAGSSMEHVLKVNVYLADLHDYKAMNEVYRGKFGKNPPVRTTVAVYGGVPGDSLVEIDCIAALKS